MTPTTSGAPTEHAPHPTDSLPAPPRPTAAGPRPSRVVVAVVVALVLLPLASACLALAQGWQPSGDVGVIGLRARDVGTGDSPLVGQPTTGAGFTKVTSWHPGPAQYYVLAPYVRTLGVRAGLLIGVSAVNSCAILATLVLAWRRGGGPLVALTAATLAVLIHALGLTSLITPFNSEFTTYLFFAAIMAMWSVLDGDLIAVPILVVAASLAAQAHVAIAAQLAVPTLIVGVVVAWRCITRPTTRRQRWAILIGVGLGVLLWSPVLAQELSAGPSNLTALYRTAEAPVAKAGHLFAFERLTAAVGPLPLFARSGARSDGMRHIGDLQIMMAVVVLGASGSLALAGAPSRRRRSSTILAALLTVIALWCWVCTATTPEEIETFRVDALRWLWVVSAWVWMSIAWNVWRLAVRDHTARWAPKLEWAGALVAAVTIAATVAASDVHQGPEGRVMTAIAAAAAETIDATPTGTYHLDFAGSDAYVNVGPGLALLLDQSGRRIEVDRNRLTTGYGHDRRTTEPGDAGQLRITTEPAARPLDHEVLIASEPTNDPRIVVKVWLTR